jgi:hypothetical protein
VSASTPARVTRCLGGHDELAGALERALGDESELLLVAPVAGPETGPDEWPTAATLGVLTRLQAVIEEDPGAAGRHCIVVVVAPQDNDPELAAASAATAEAMRGVVQSVSREVDPGVLRVNVVIGRERGRDDVLRSVRLLSSPGGRFFVGATLDVR